ncbi:MAG TPA: FAD-binding oxidoreductase [Burkholderiaceae bacterium]|jgi:FAD/FMN-containing dehydrogenase|nr:FAD-binding oxidoreductase [Burkholderiaceae bacterium]
MTERSRRIATALTEAVGASSVLTQTPDLEGYTADWRGRYRGPAICVALPSTTEQVATVVRRCVAERVPVLAQGGNTSLCGGAVPDAAGEPPVIVNLQRMRAVRALDAANSSIVVEAGCVLAAVQETAAAAGRLYPISLGAEGSCQIGGNIATNAGGTGVLRYGNTRENVLGLEVVLPDGSVWEGLSGLRKNNTGFDLKHLFIGAEGTLGIVTAACLKLHPLPTAHALAWCALRSPEAALELLALVQAAAGARLSAFEMINALQLQLVLEQLPDRRRPLAGEHAWHVLVELADTGAAGELQDALQAVLQSALERGIVVDGALATSETQRAAFWQVRHSVSEANKKAGVGLTTDCAVPISAVPRFIAEATRAVRGFVPDMEVLVVAHLGDGNAHFIPFLRFDAWERLPDREATGAAIKRSVNDVAHALGGTFSAEHGIGRTLLAEMAAYKPAIELELMRSIKQALDPHNLFNPGRLLPARSATAQ